MRRVGAAGRRRRRASICRWAKLVDAAKATCPAGHRLLPRRRGARHPRRRLVPVRAAASPTRRTPPGCRTRSLSSRYSGTPSPGAASASPTSPTSRSPTRTCFVSPRLCAFRGNGAVDPFIDPGYAQEFDAAVPDHGVYEQGGHDPQHWRRVHLRHQLLMPPSRSTASSSRTPC
ncbi:hypothetical protein GQ55_2G455200 [Panicum hallii var. hallii]|uniref:Uncharacterized protein n=1 Tax=Panicum hallii var. hallii TaxID=1504633 RepID=A0A2T7EZE7_9POAL|nr:hypothetical protein GQ55_2G455200 [Panicum hallii var. hallii]